MGGKARSQSSAGQRPAAGRDPARAASILQTLHAMWGEATCELDHESPYQLLVATMLSAQSTDRRVNEVTPALFARYPDARALARAEPRALEALIRATGFQRMKARHLIAMAQAVVDRHGGAIPRTLGELVKLPGVARKTANVVLGTAFGVSSGVVVDTHVQRVSRRLGLTEETEPRAIERALMALIPRDRWIDVSQELIWHGRRVCGARSPACARCDLAPLCPSAQLPAREPW